MNNPLVIDAASGGARVPMFESLYMYNMLDGSMVPLLADGPYEWNDDLTELTIQIKPAARWSDGTPVTAHDVAYTYYCAVKYENNSGVANRDYIETIEAIDDLTLVIKAVLNDAGQPANPLVLLDYVVANYVIQKAWLETLEERHAGDAVAIKNDTGEDVVWSGPYTKYFADDSKTIVVRDDNYWGQDETMWGKLPTPKYLAHMVYPTNNAGDVAFAAGEVDVSQQFIANVQDLWLRDNLPISTYLPEAPYGITASIPTAWFNLSVPGLDNQAVRKAIAMAVDYDTIIANAMTNQSPTFAEVPRSVMNPTAGEQALYNQEAVAHLQWVGSDIDGANALLDEAGILRGPDGWRYLDGEKLSFNACCPNGWTDWMAAMEIVAAAGEKIGIEITTLFPEWDVYQTVVTAAEQTEYEIFMMWTDSASPSMPWARVRQLLSSEYVGVEGNWSGNWGGYSNDRIDEIIKLIPLETDHAALVDYYTEVVEIYLTEVPSFGLMYRPYRFHTVNESVWTGFTEMDDGNNIPPLHCTDGYAIADLYNLTLVNP